MNNDIKVSLFAMLFLIAGAELGQFFMAAGADGYGGLMVLVGLVAGLSLVLAHAVGAYVVPWYRGETA